MTGTVSNASGRIRRERPRDPGFHRRASWFAGGALSLIGLAWSVMPFGPASADCVDPTTIQNYTGTANVICPCFETDEEAGVVLTAPAGDYPLEILRVGIAWASQFGGTASSLENAIRIYQGGLPAPGPMIFELEGPMLNDGAFNQFDLEPLPGRILVESGPFSVTLKFLNANAGNIFAPSVVHDNNGCQANKNLVYAVPGGWQNACALGVGGDWLFYVVYRPCVSTTGVGETRIGSPALAMLMPPHPNPSRGDAEFEFLLARGGPARVRVLDVGGRQVAELADGPYTAGVHRSRWDGKLRDGTPAPSGVYFVELAAGAVRATRRLLIAR